MPIIDQFTNQYAFLSNFYPCFIEGRSVEHFYQAAKTDDEIEKNLILSQETPGKAKRMGQKITLRKDWETVKAYIMLDLLREKFENPHLRQLLLNTGDAMLIEGNMHHDNFWGKCNCSGCMISARHYNMLGVLLMYLREEIRREQDAD